MSTLEVADNHGSSAPFCSENSLSLSESTPGSSFDFTFSCLKKFFVFPVMLKYVFAKIPKLLQSICVYIILPGLPVRGTQTVIELNCEKLFCAFICSISIFIFAFNDFDLFRGKVVEFINELVNFYFKGFYFCLFV